jgi:hypothetical protein
MEILQLTVVGQARFESHPSAKLVNKCTSSGDVFFDERPEGGAINVINCPVIGKRVRYSGSICMGPEDKSGCEFNRLT